MKEIVIKFDLEQHDIRVYSPYLEEADAAKILLAAFISITETLDDDIKKSHVSGCIGMLQGRVVQPKN